MNEVNDQTIEMRAGGKVWLAEGTRARDAPAERREAATVAGAAELRADESGGGDSGDGQPPVNDGTAGDIEINGYAAVFDTLSEDLGGFREKIAPGAFAASIQRDDVRALFNHNAERVLGRVSAGTLSLSEDEKGLRFRVLAPNVGWVRDLSESIRRGDVDQCSFGFQAIAEEWEDGDPALRTLTEVRLLDVSVVTYPAYQQTHAAVRAFQSTTPREEAKRELKFKWMRARLALAEVSIPASMVEATHS